LPGAGGFAGGFRNKAILVKFPHFGGVNHTQLNKKSQVDDALFILKARAESA
jgi:hypothetical protein